jgi:hypothetical protein
MTEGDPSSHWTNRHLPSVGLHDVHDQRGQENDQERNRTKLRGGFVDVAEADVPNKKSKREKTEGK